VFITAARPPTSSHEVGSSPTARPPTTAVPRLSKARDPGPTAFVSTSGGRRAPLPTEFRGYAARAMSRGRGTELSRRFPRRTGADRAWSAGATCPLCPSSDITDGKHLHPESTTHRGFGPGGPGRDQRTATPPVRCRGSVAHLDAILPPADSPRRGLDNARKGPSCGNRSPTFARIAVLS